MAGKGKPRKAAKNKEERSDRMAEKMAAEAGQKALEQPVSPAGTPIKVNFRNTSTEEALLYLVDSSGIERFMLKLGAGQSTGQSCVSPAKWTVKVGGKELKLVANQDGANFQIESDGVKAG